MIYTFLVAVVIWSNYTDPTCKYYQIVFILSSPIKLIVKFHIIYQVKKQNL